MQEKKRDGDTYTRTPDVPSGRLPPLSQNSAGFRSGAKEDANSDDKTKRGEPDRSRMSDDATLPQTQGEKEKLGKPGEAAKPRIRATAPNEPE
jgi:hypothetical protein